MEPMFEAAARTVLAARSAGESVTRRSIRLVGRTESQADEMLEPLYRAWAKQAPPIEATILVARAIIELQLRVRTRAASDADAVLERAARQVADTFGPDIVSLTGDSLEKAVGDLLRARGLRVAIAESCTGGLVTSRLTDVPGSSDYLDRSVVVYSNAAKTQVLGVPEPLIAAHGAVSEPVAVAMAEGVRRMAGVDVGLAITGIAGPGGGTPAKPVGTVAIAVDGPDGYRFVRTSLLGGSREMIKTFSSTAAIDRLRRAVLGVR
jgi:nicotinamide-nucleotide amidase